MVAKSRLEAAGPPRGLLRFAFRAPVALYRARLGFLLGTRFLMLEHRGRKTGKTRRAVLEVVAERPNAFYVAAPWKTKAQWLQNVRADPHVVVHCGSQRFETVAKVIGRDEARSILGEYAANHPGTFRRLARLMLDDPGNTLVESLERAAAVIPLVELPRPS